MKRLNFSPHYETYLRSGSKTTTLRLTNKQAFRAGDAVMLTVGWNSAQARELHPARIQRVYCKPVAQLGADDLEGESPDCHSSESARLVLSTIYHRVLRDDDPVVVIKFEHRH